MALPAAASLSPSPRSSKCRCISSASARASTIWRRSRRTISPVPWSGLNRELWKSARRATHTPLMTPKPQLNPILKLALDLGPLVLFFFANSHYDIFVATATFMVAVLVAMVVSYALTRHFPIMTIVTAVIVLVFGGLTLFLHNDMFIKIKPTIIYALL